MECQQPFFFLDGPAAGFLFQTKLTNLLVEDDPARRLASAGDGTRRPPAGLAHGGGLGKLSLTVLPLTLRVRRN